MEEGGEVVAEALCDVAEKLHHKKGKTFHKVHDTVILTALAAGAFAAHTSEMKWQKLVMVDGLAFAGGVGVLSSYAEKMRHSRKIALERHTGV